MAISVMVFSLAWNLRHLPGNRQWMILGFAFLGVALIDLAHALSFPGMPDFVSPNSTEKAINFWLAARLLAAVALLSVAAMPVGHCSAATCRAGVVATLAIASLVVWVGVFHSSILPRTFIEGQGLTPFKTGAEYVLSALYALACILLARRGIQTGNADLLWLAAGAWIQGLAELTLTLYANATDSVNLLGHVYKAIAFLMVYRALFVAGIRAPFLEASREHSRLRALLSSIPDLIWLKDANGVYLTCNKAFEQFFGANEAAIVGKTDADFVSAEQAAFFRSHDLAAMAAGGPTVNEEFLTFATGGYQGLFETTKIPVLDAQGGIIGVLGIARDITERRQTERAMQTSASVFTHAREGIMITDADSQIVDVNEAFTRITGYTREDVLGKNPRILSSGRQPPAYYETMWTALQEAGFWTSEVWNRRKNGEVFAELQTISAVHDSKGQVQQYVSLFSDISAFKEHEIKLEHIAHYDALTNLPNRVLMADRLHQTISQRHGQVAVVFFDLDGFKAINDSFGHEAGDHLLITLSQRMKSMLREGDTLARMGGDEFAVVLQELDDTSTCVPLLNRMLAAAAEPVQFGTEMLQVSASAGVTFYPQAEDVDGEQLLRQADQAMYQAKVAGKNRFHVFDAVQDRSMRGYHESVERIRRALAEREFVLHYQPQVNMRTGKVVGFEALIRWQHPQRGLLSPAAFLPLIENHVVAIDIGEWVIDAALSQLEQWGAAGMSLPVSVNIGASQLQQANFVERVAALLAAHPSIPPSRLEMEVLETSALEDVQAASQVIEECKRMGVLFALDDFGTGYSSLTYLKRLPVALLKIDQSFVRDMLADSSDLAILEGIIGLAAAFRRKVIAEGVETVEHGTRLLAIGCDLAQGYGIARPMPAADVPAWVAQWRPDAAWALN